LAGATMAVNHATPCALSCNCANGVCDCTSGGECFCPNCTCKTGKDCCKK
jgi:hypothetical protein